MKKRNLLLLINELMDRVEVLEAEFAAESSTPDVSYVVELRDPKPISFSTPLTFNELANEVLGPYAYYIEENDVFGPGGYL